MADINKVKFHYAYPISIDIDRDKNVDVYIDQCNMEPTPKDHIRIIIIEEPKKTPFYYQMKERTDLYAFLLTFHDEILTTNPKSRLFNCVNAWVRGFVSKQKRFSVSTVVGGKNDPAMEGYAMRHELWRSRESIMVPREFYLSGNAVHSHHFVHFDGADYSTGLILGSSKEPLFDSMFHIAIENTSIKNYFSEKIVDCFQSMTVPIYYGCKNIENYFNTSGMFRVNSVSEIIELCNQLTPELYERMLPAMKDNYERSKNWLDHSEQMKNGVLAVLKEGNM